MQRRIVQLVVTHQRVLRGQSEDHSEADHGRTAVAQEVQPVAQRPKT